MRAIAEAETFNDGCTLSRRNFPPLNKSIGREVYERAVGSASDSGSGSALDQHIENGEMTRTRRLSTKKTHPSCVLPRRVLRSVQYDRIYFQGDLTGWLVRRWGIADVVNWRRARRTGDWKCGGGRVGREMNGMYVWYGMVWYGKGGPSVGR